MIVRNIHCSKLGIIGDYTVVIPLFHISADKEDAFIASNLVGGAFEKVASIPPSREGLYKRDDNGAMIEDMERVSEKNKEKRYERLEAIFRKKVIGLKSLVIDKPYMTNEEAILQQFDSYEALYAQAKNGAFDATTNLAVITANEGAKLATAELNLLANTIRGVLEQMIEVDAPDVDTKLDVVDAFTISNIAEAQTALPALLAEFGL